MSKWRSVFPMALLAGLLGCVSKGRPTPPTVEVAEVEPADADIYLEFLGQTFARSMVDVGVVKPDATQPLTTIAPLDPIWVRFTISEAQFLSLIEKTRGPVEEGPRLELILSDNSVFPYAGQIVNLLNQADARTGTLELQAEFPNPRHRLLPGHFLRVRYVIEHRTGVILVPQRAVQQKQKVQSVFTVGREDKIQVRVVRTGARIGDAWLIEQGLEPGDRVVVEGFLAVGPGVVVHPIPYQASIHTAKALE
jgi:membrane fusion protein, multidrug efflux system